MRKSEKGDNSAKYLQNFIKSQSGHLHHGHSQYAKYHDPSSSGYPDILLTRFHRFTMRKSDVTHKSTVARTVMCRQDGRGRFPVLLDDLSKYRTNSQRKSQLS